MIVVNSKTKEEAGLSPNVHKDREALVEHLKRIALLAGIEIMTVYSSDFTAEVKSDQSPVTEADKRAEKIILRELALITPDVPVISEEAASMGHIPSVTDVFFLVDPLDGTKEFINRNSEFTVNIALIENGTPSLGVVYAPALPRMFFSFGEGHAFEQKVDPSNVQSSPEKSDRRSIRVRKPPAGGLTAVTSRSHRSEKTDEYLRQYNIGEFLSAGSSLKFCLVAAGEADIYPRHGTTMEWDTAAGNAILIGAGGHVTELSGTRLIYGKSQLGFKNPYFVAFGANPSPLRTPESTRA